MKKIFDKISLFLLAYSLLFIFFSDFFYYFQILPESFGSVSLFFWWWQIFSLVVFSFYSLIKMIIFSLKTKNFLFLSSLVFLIIIVFLGTNDPRNLSGETTQEISCIVNHLNTSPDKGFWRTCMFGYPSRQYYLMALPTLLFGRNLFSLNIGAFLYFFICFTIFSLGIIEYFGLSKINDVVISLIYIFFLHVYYIIHFLFLYENSIYPFLLSVLSIGLSLLYLKNFNKKILVLLGFSLYLLIFSYTPSLAVFFLFLAFSFTYFLKRGIKKEELFIIFASLLLFIFSLKVREDINLINLNQRDLNSLLGDLKILFKHFFLQEEGTPFVSNFFKPFFLMMIFLALARFFGLFGLIVGLWSVAVILISVLAKGYSYYGVDFRLHRAIIIFPPLLLNLLIFIKKIKFENIKGKKINLFLAIVFIFYLFTGYFFLGSIINKREVSLHYLLIDNLKNLNYDFKNKKEVYLFFDPLLETEFISLNDSLQYFYPNIRSDILKEDCQIDEFYKNKEVIFIYKDQDNLCNEFKDKKNLIGEAEIRNIKLLFFKMKNQVKPIKFDLF